MSPKFLKRRWHPLKRDSKEKQPCNSRYISRNTARIFLSPLKPYFFARIPHLQAPATTLNGTKRLLRFRDVPVLWYVKMSPKKPPLGQTTAPPKCCSHIKAPADTTPSTDRES